MSISRSQNDFIELMKILNYKITIADNGICYALVLMWIKAILVDESPKFESRFQKYCNIYDRYKGKNLANIIAQLKLNKFNLVEKKIEIEKNIKDKLNAINAPNLVELIESEIKAKLTDEEKEQIENILSENNISLDDKCKKLINQIENKIIPKLNQHEEDLLEMSTFFDSIDVIQQMFERQNLFESNKAMIFGDTIQLNTLTDSVALEKLGGTSNLDRFSTICNEGELVNYLTQFKDFIESKKMDIPIPFLISNEAHAIGVYYHYRSKKWYIMNPDRFPTNMVETELDLVSDIANSFERVTNVTEFVTMIVKDKLKIKTKDSFALSFECFTRGKDIEKTKEFFKVWKQTKEFEAFTKVTTEKALRKDTEGSTWLSIASSIGEEEVVKKILIELVKKKHPVDVISKNQFYPLLIALYRGRKNVVELLLLCGANPNPIYFMDPFIITAIRGRNLPMVEQLIDFGAKVNVFSNTSQSPLLIACEDGYPAMVEMLLKKGIDPNLGRDSNYSPMYAACKHGRGEIVSLLLKYGYVLTSIEEANEALPLFLAIQNNHRDIVKLLIEQGLDISASCWLPASELMRLANSSQKMKQFINLQKEKNPNHTAIKITASEFADLINSELVNTIKEAALHFRNTKGLYEAAKAGELDKVNQIMSDLIERKINLNTIFLCNMHPIEAAIRNHHKNIVSVLLKFGTDPNLVVNSRYLLDIAIEAQDVEIAKLLIQYGAEINHKGKTSLYIACEKGDLNMINMLLGKITDLNTFDKDSIYSPMYAACRNGRMDVVNLLLNKKYKLSIENAVDVLSLFIAIQNNDEKIVQTLLQNGLNISKPYVVTVEQLMSLPLGDQVIKMKDFIRSNLTKIDRKQADDKLTISITAFEFANFFNPKMNIILKKYENPKSDFSMELFKQQPIPTVSSGAHLTNNNNSKSEISPSSKI